MTTIKPGVLTPNINQLSGVNLKFVASEWMRGLDFGLIFFNDDSKIYLCPERCKRIEVALKTGNHNLLEKLTFFVTGYSESDRSIEELVREIKEKHQQLIDESHIVSE